MAFQFTPAKRENVGLLIGLAGASGSGKTFTALRLATGMSGGKPFALIDTEAGRAKHYADRFKFDHGNLTAPFRPESYIEAIKAADAAGYPVIVVDSVSHVWAGDGGVLDWHEEELDRMAGSDWKKRESCKMAAWIKPKMSHKKFVQSLLQVKAHLILCFRAEEKIEMVRENGKTVIVPKPSITGHDGWIPICEKSLPFELTMSLLFKPDQPGIPVPIKLQEQHRPMVDMSMPVDETTGENLADWAGGGKTKIVDNSDAIDTLKEYLSSICKTKSEKSDWCYKKYGVKKWQDVEKLDSDVILDAIISYPTQEQSTEITDDDIPGLGDDVG